MAAARAWSIACLAAVGACVAVSPRAAGAAVTARPQDGSEKSDQPDFQNQLNLLNDTRGSLSDRLDKQLHPGDPAAFARSADREAPDAPREAESSLEMTRAAARALQVRDDTTAERLATEAIALNPKNAQALNYRAMARNQSGRYEEAFRDADAALVLAPGNAAILHTRSWALAKERRYREALRDANAALARQPLNPFLRQDQAFALAGLGDRVGALDALRRSAELDERFAGRYERALQLPAESDLTPLFGDAAEAPRSSPAPAPAPDGFWTLAVLAASGGLLVALAILHVVSASWRERMLLTARRVLGTAPAAPGRVETPAGAFWTQYALVRQIGLGGMGVVYEAVDRALERRVAVKRMRDEVRLDPHERRRFVHEARLVAQLHHPNIVDIYAIIEDGAEVYLVFEFVEGRTLQDVLRFGGTMDFETARRVVGEMAAAVSHAHAHGVIHRDLKPLNVMLTPDGRVKVMDFGVAREAKDAATRRARTNTIVGTPPYMAPEQEQGAVRRESDVYALGVCLYEMIAGRLPFSGSAMLADKLRGRMTPLSRLAGHLPPGIDDALARALAPDPDRRYRTPAELLAALDALTPPLRRG